MISHHVWQSILLGILRFIMVLAPQWACASLHIVADLGSDPQHATAFSVTPLNDKVLFTSLQTPMGTELWVSDGSASGTHMILDILPGAAGSDPRELTRVGDLIYFTAITENNMRELWVTDGSSEGTFSLAPAVAPFNEDQYLSPAAFAGRLYFTFETTETGRELWSSDGTLAGTGIVIDLLEGPSSSRPSKLTVAAGRLFFYAYDFFTGAELYQTDGTPDGTHLVKDINPGFFSANIEQLTEYNNRLIFLANDGVHGLEPWVSDGTEQGTTLLLDANPGPSSAFAQFRRGFQHLYILYGQNWRTDGTIEGTVPVESLPRIPDVDGVSTGQKEYFTSGTGGGQREVFVYDHVTQQIHQVSDFQSSNGNSVRAGLWASNDHVFLQTQNAFGDTELWAIQTSNNELSTQGLGQPSLVNATALAVINQELLYLSQFLYAVDPQQSPRLVKNLSAGTRDGVGSLFTMGNRLLFDVNRTMNGDINNRQLWTTQGTAQTTQPLANQPEFSLLNQAVAVGNRLVGNGGFSRLWSVNDQSAGPLTPAGHQEPPDPNWLTSVGNSAYFVARNDTNNNALWRTDGSESGTVLVQPAGTETYSNATNLIGMQRPGAADLVLFVAQDSAHGRELWSSDGTAENTQLLKNIASSTTSSFPEPIGQVNDVVCLWVNDPDTGKRQLWRTDGSNEGTVRLHAEMTFQSFNWHVDNAQFFFVEQTDFSDRLWRSDCTENGLTQLDIDTGAEHFRITELLDSVDGQLFFTGDRNSTGNELWATNPANTQASMVKDIHTDVVQGFGTGSSPRYATEHNGLLYFSARSHDTIGRLLWSSDGTAAGTQPVPRGGIGYHQDVVATPVSLGTNLFVAIEDAYHGRELWRLPASDGDLDSDGTPNSLDECPADPSGINDLDGDGICDVSDNCPDVPNHTQLDWDNDGIGGVCDASDVDEQPPTPPIDTDNDGIPDIDDSDDDNDGLSDVFEVEIGTDPLNSSDCPAWICQNKVWQKVLTKKKGRRR